MFYLRYLLSKFHLFHRSDKFCLCCSDNLEDDVDGLPGGVETVHSDGLGHHAPPPPGDLVGEDVLVVEDLRTYRLQLSHVAVERVAANVVQLFQDFLFDVRCYLNHHSLLKLQNIYNEPAS